MAESMNGRLAWLESHQDPPTRMRTYHAISLLEFETRVRSYDEELTENIYAGDAYIIRDVIEASILEEMKKKAREWGEQRDQEYQPMIEGARDFHQLITEDGAAKLYKISPIRHSYFFFRWNGDPLGAFKHGDHIWGLVKTFGGFSYDEFINNKPRDGIVDRSQIAHYPPGAGLIPKHTDPFHNQKLILGVYMSQYGEDFEEGGIYFVDQNEREILLEPFIKKGDAVVAYPTMVHGVARIDPHREPDWDTNRGRWFLGLYTNDSNEKKDRVTSRKVNV